MDDMYAKGQDIRFNWGTEVLGGVVENHRGGWVMIEPDDYRGVFAVRDTQVWLPGEEAKEPDSGVQVGSTLPSEAVDAEVVAT